MNDLKGLQALLGREHQLAHRHQIRPQRLGRTICIGKGLERCLLKRSGITQRIKAKHQRKPVALFIDIEIGATGDGEVHIADRRTL